MASFTAGFSRTIRMQPPFSLNIKQYRSINEGCIVPFSHKTTFVVGPNNSGKSNILRALSAVFNKQFSIGDNNHEYDLIVSNSNFMKFADNYQNLKRSLPDFKDDFVITIKGGTLVQRDAPPEILQYAESNRFLNDFGNSSSANANCYTLMQRLFQQIEPNLVGTVYVPNTRYITTPGREPDNFTKLEVAGTVLQYGNIVEELSALNRPRTENRTQSREKFKKIEDFLAYCLDKRDVHIEVPFDKSTIHIDIDGSEFALQDLGTGIEQLLIIGLASFGFTGKLTLVDEPELHFHPTAQKRMVKYLNDTLDSSFVFATHSAAILDSVDADVLQVRNDGTRSIISTVVSNKERYQAVRDLGHSPSDLLLTRFAIWVEGPSDRVYLNHWIGRIDPTLIEGVDFTVLFYGGKILSHHSFIEEDSELVKAVSLARAFAVLMDSDRKPDKPNINSTKSRVREEIERQGGICWITEGREVENYLPAEVICKLAAAFPGTSIPATKLDQILDPEKVKKNDFARSAIAIESDDWPLDLKKRVTELVEAIQGSR